MTASPCRGMNATCTLAIRHRLQGSFSRGLISRGQLLYSAACLVFGLLQTNPLRTSVQVCSSPRWVHHHTQAIAVICDPLSTWLSSSWIVDPIRVRRCRASHDHAGHADCRLPNSSSASSRLSFAWHSGPMSGPEPLPPWLRREARRRRGRDRVVDFLCITLLALGLETGRGLDQLFCTSRVFSHNTPCFGCLFVLVAQGSVFQLQESALQLHPLQSLELSRLGPKGSS